MISFFKLFSGYCRVIITGPGKERFLNLCRNKKILVWNLLRKEDSYVFFVSYKAHKLLAEISEKTNTKVRIEGKYGLPFFLYRHKKRKVFFLGILMCVLSLFVLSLFIWDIQIKGTEKYTADEINTYLKDHKITTGILKKEINCAVLEEKIREDFPDTAWVSCDIEGTLLTIHVKESIDTSDMEKIKNDVPNDIIAAKDGIIESIVTRSGTPLVKTKDSVKKGDTLISGVIHLYNDYDELLETTLTSADGDIKARTVYEYKESFPLAYYEKCYTGSEVKSYDFCFGEYKISFPSKNIRYENYDKVTENKSFRLGKSFYLPVSLYVTCYKEYSPEKITLNEAEAKEKANSMINYYLSQMEKEGKEIKGKQFQVNMEEGECFIKGSVTVLESIGKIRNIP